MTTFIIQAEMHTRQTGVGVSTWTVATSPASYQGAGLMVLANGFAGGCATPPVMPCPELEFDVEITQAMTYRFFARMYASNGSEDSLYFAIDTESPISIDTDEINPAWRWEGNHARTLSVGMHTIHVWVRNSNIKLDAVALMPSTTPPP